MGYSPCGCKELDTTEQLTHTGALGLQHVNIWRWRGPRHAVCNILKQFSIRLLVSSQALLYNDYFKHLGMTCRGQTQEWHRQSPSARAQLLAQLPQPSPPCLRQCSSTCGKGLQSRVVQCMHKVTGRHGNECPALSKPAAYSQCHQEVCNDKINVNTITSPRLGECFC